MAEPQRIGTPLVEANVALEPPTPHALTISTFIQRTWSLLFGRRKNTLRALYANNGGALAVAPIPLTDMVYVGTFTIADETWIDLGKLVDLVMYQYDASVILHSIVEGSVDGTNAVCADIGRLVSVRTEAGQGFDGNVGGVFYARVQHVRFPGLSIAAQLQGRLVAYNYIDN